jgi:tRNA-2-methylthio-N6-dimethylallyladenosine synthase
MFTTTLTHSTTLHDESRQGEAFALTENTEQFFEKYFYIESYGCAMNFNDSEIVASILHNEGYGVTKDASQANLILINTCSIRDKAEQTVRKRLQQFIQIKKQNKGLLVGVLGCMAERLKSKFLEEEKLVDMVIGPDAYKSLPTLIAEAQGGQKAINVLLSREETYAEINPVRLDSNGVCAYVSIMRGCNNMCSFCVVPFTRGRERSRDVESILAECKNLIENGYKEITLLGQNVDSYEFTSNDDNSTTSFAQLLEKVALLDSTMRIRFSTSHPKDITDDVLFTIAKYDNICNYIHLPVQSGSTRILQLMNRTYTKEWYMKKVDRIKELIPNCGLSTDVIVGFCTETEADHQETLAMMNYAKYDLAYMYAYSEREGTLAARRFEDDVTEEIKSRRLSELIAVHRANALESNEKEMGTIHTVLVEGESKKNNLENGGRSDNNKYVVFAKGESKKGDYVKVKITYVTSGTLKGEIVG